MSKKNLLFIVIGALIIGLLVFVRIDFNELLNEQQSIDESIEVSAPTVDDLTKSFQEFPDLQEDLTREEGITIDDLSQGCPRRDCIPSIDNPVFESVEEADNWLNDEDLVFGVNIDGDARAYPQRILNWHEIVNDTVGGQDIAVTFCPLCGSALSFERTVIGQTAEFGVSGRLYNSNLVMYDRLEENFWQQETGVAIIGPAAKRGEELNTIPMASVFWEEWKELNPDSKILSRDTGYARDYNRYPYGTYEEDGELYFGIENTDTRLPLKEPGYGFVINENFSKFYPANNIPTNSEIIDEIDASKLLVNSNTEPGQASFDVVQELIIRNEDGLVTMQVGDEEVVPIRTFWFAFAAFHPDAEIYTIE